MLSPTMTMVVMALYMFILYYILIPKMNGGMIIDLPGSTSSQKTVNITHGVIFVVVFMLTSKYVLKMAGGN